MVYTWGMRSFFIVSGEIKEDYNDFLWKLLMLKWRKFF